MLDVNSILTRIADRVSYADVKLQRLLELEVAIKVESVDIFKQNLERATCRVVASGGYGVVTTNRLDTQHIGELSEEALKQAKSLGGGVTLQPVEVQAGEVEHPERKEFETGQAAEFLRFIAEKLKKKLEGTIKRLEVVTSHYHNDSTLVTSEGTNIHEKTPTTDLTIYAIVKGVNQGFASRILGGRGGLEVLEEQPWEDILDKLAARAKDSAKAGATPSDLTMRRHRVVLDNEAAGAMAHELAHLLEADTYERVLFQGLKVPKDFALVDNPSLESGYGSFCWDDEGVKGVEKTLLSQLGVNLLHTRMTAVQGVKPGNAHGTTRMPRPMASNIYIKPSDWRLEEIFEDARRGIYAEGVVRAETDTSNGRIELQPEIAYIFEKKEFRNPVRKLASYIVVGKLDKEVAGYVLSTYSWGKLHILDVAVKKSKRRMGMGKMLVKHLISHALEKGLPEVYCEVKARNVPALNLFTSLGFRFKLFSTLVQGGSYGLYLPIQVR